MVWFYRGGVWWEEGAKEGTEKKSDCDNFEDHLGLLNVVRRQPAVGCSPPL